MTVTRKSPFGALSTLTGPMCLGKSMAGMYAGGGEYGGGGSLMGVDVLRPRGGDDKPGEEEGDLGGERWIMGGEPGMDDAVGDVDEDDGDEGVLLEDAGILHGLPRPNLEGGGGVNRLLLIPPLPGTGVPLAGNTPLPRPRHRPRI